LEELLKVSDVKLVELRVGWKVDGLVARWAVWMVEK